MTPVARQSRKPVFIGTTVILATALAFGSYRLFGSPAKFPLGHVQRKDFVEYVELKGQVKAMRSDIIIAPYSAGDLQIMKLAGNGDKVKKGDTLVEFDTTTIKQKLAQDQSALKSAEAEIAQSQANAKLKEEQDVTDVMAAKFAVEKARLDASKQEILSRIEGEQAKLKLADAQQKLMEGQSKLDANRSAAKADVFTLQQKRNQAAYLVTQDQRAVEALTLRAPLAGVVTLQSHWQPPNSMTVFRAGDRTSPGVALAELPDPSSLKITARVEETQRGQLQAGQSASIHLDAVPDQNFDAKVDSISPTASLDFTAGWPIPRNFSLELSLANSDARLTPGMAAVVRIAVDKVQNGTVISAAGLFRKSGHTVAYRRRGTKFEEVEVDVLRRSGDEVLLARGLEPGDQIALEDPTLAK